MRHGTHKRLLFCAFAALKRQIIRFFGVIIFMKTKSFKIGG